MNTEEQLAELSLRNFVRDRALSILKSHIGEKDINPDEIMAELNQTLLADFKRIAQDEFNNLLKQIGALLEVKS